MVIISLSSVKKLSVYETITLESWLKFASEFLLEILV